MESITIFSGRQIIDTAIQTEEYAEIFYTNAAQATDIWQVKQLCEWLAGEEKTHLRTFQKMKESVGPPQVPEEWPGEKHEFIDALLKSRFLPDLSEAGAWAKDLSPTDFLPWALNFEKDHIIFLYEMRDIVPPADVDTVNRIIREEKIHVTIVGKAQELLQQQLSLDSVLAMVSQIRSSDSNTPSAYH